MANENWHIHCVFPASKSQTIEVYLASEMLSKWECVRDDGLRVREIVEKPIW